MSPRLLLLLAGLSAAIPCEAQLRSFVIANGGGTCSGSGHVLRATVGQGAIGVTGGPSFIVCAGYWCLAGAPVVAVGDPRGGASSIDVPRELSFGLPMPTPSRGDVAFAIGLPWPAEVSLTVFDVAGRQIGETLSHRFEAGHHRLSWRTTTEASGVYFGILAVDGVAKARRRIILVR